LTLGVRRAVPADIFLRLAWAGAQAPDQPRELQQCLVDVILPLDKHAMTQRRLEALADAFADSFLDRYFACSSRLRHRVGEISRELYRKPRRLCVADSECSLAWRLPTGGLALIDQQCPPFDFLAASPRSASLVSGV